MIEVEEDYAGFINIDIRNMEYGKLELSQTGLIYRIIYSL